MLGVQQAVVEYTAYYNEMVEASAVSIAGNF